MKVKMWQFFIAAFLTAIGLLVYVVETQNRLPKEIPAPLISREALEPKVPPPLMSPDTQPIASISAQSYIAYDVASGEVITAKDPDKRLMPASTTKIMTALVAMDEYDPKEIITISRAAAAAGHIVDFTVGEQFTVGDIIKAMMINSGNDAAVSLADHHSFGYQTFVSLMNKKAEAFGLKNTHFSNVSGFEAEDHYSTARDLSKLSLEAMNNPTIREIVSTKTATITTIDGKTVHKLENLNRLLWDVPGVIGIKTGWTENAGDCLVSYVSRDGHDIIVVVLASKDRFADSTALIEWIYKNTRW